MFSVIFEVQPGNGQGDAYLDHARMLRPELEQVPGFLDNVRYKSLNRGGWILSLSDWLDEKSVVRWRIQMRHHEAQVRGREEILSDYHLRVGEITYDTHPPEGCQVLEHRFDETEVGEGTAITLITASKTAEWVTGHNPQEIALYLGFDHNSFGDCISWDVFEALLSPGELILLVSWKDQAVAMNYAQTALVPEDGRVRAMRVIRDYAKFDRREAPQYFPDAAGRESMHR